MNKVILEMPIGITMEFASWDATYSDISGFAWTGFFTPSNTKLSGEFSDIFVIFEIRPEFNFSAGFFLDYFTNYGDGWCNVSPRAAPDY